MTQDQIAAAEQALVQLYDSIYLLSPDIVELLWRKYEFSCDLYKVKIMCPAITVLTEENPS
jgi:hypothetical protein